MSLDHPPVKPHDRLAAALEGDLSEVARVIRERMQSEAAPRIPAVTAHLIEAGGKQDRVLPRAEATRGLADSQPAPQEGVERGVRVRGRFRCPR